MINNRKKILYIALILSSIVSSYLIWRNKIISNRVNYRVEKVQLGDITKTVSASGTLNPVILVNVGAQVTGKVQKLYADFNQHVNEGEILLELDSSLLSKDVEYSEAAVCRAQANLDLATANLKRGNQLSIRKFISQQDLEFLIEAQKRAKSELDLAKASLAKDKTNLNHTIIKSPVSGIIVDRQVDEGQTVTASFQTPILFKIAKDLSKMQIDTNFAEADIGSILPDQEVTFTVDAFPDRNFSGTVKQIRLNPVVQQNVVTYNVVIIVENKDKILLPGMTAYVDIKIEEKKGVLLVSNAALRFKPKEISFKQAPRTIEANIGVATIHRVNADGSLEPFLCKVGISNVSQSEILSCDLKNQDQVAIGYLTNNATADSFKFRAF